MRNKFQHRYTFHALIIALIVALLGIGYGAYSYFHKTTYPENSSGNTIGVLINQEMGYVDFTGLQKSTVDFVYLRATQGKSYFDDRYLTNRDRLQATNLEFGTVHYFSDESTPQSQFEYFQTKVGTNTGQLPVLLIPAIEKPTAKFYQQEAKFAELLLAQNIRVMVLGNFQQIQKYFKDLPISYMADSTKVPKDKNNYQMWQYTNNGQVVGTTSMEDITMFTYLHSQTDYDNFVK